MHAVAVAVVVRRKTVENWMLSRGVVNLGVSSHDLIYARTGPTDHLHTDKHCFLATATTFHVFSHASASSSAMCDCPPLDFFSDPHFSINYISTTILCV